MKRWLLILLLPLAVLGQVNPPDDPQDDPPSGAEWDDAGWDDAGWDEESAASAWSGFVEAGFGGRLSSDPLIAEHQTLAELRWRLEGQWQPGNSTVNLKSDFYFDGVDVGWHGDLREANVAFTLADRLDFRVGRQVQTWGTGDLLFLNDLFPKDFVSFFAARDDEYLKAPGNALRLTRYSEVASIDLVWTPEFEPDRYLTGQRFSFFSALAGTNIAPVPPLAVLEPDRALANGELALRLFRTVAGREYTFYGYRGFFKQPVALTPTLQPTFSALSAVGASLRRPLGPGLLNFEGSWYLSRDDRDGSNPRVPNDQLRLLVGYEWEARPRFSVGLQYYLEKTLDYRSLLDSSPDRRFVPDQHRHLLTNRLTWRTGRDRHTWSLFTFYSPSDQDFYLRPGYTFRYSDQWTLTAGGNFFGGDQPQTFFNQLEDASNAFLRLRLNY